MVGRRIAVEDFWHGVRSRGCRRPPAVTGLGSAVDWVHRHPSYVLLDSGKKSVQRSADPTNKTCPPASRHMYYHLRFSTSSSLHAAHYSLSYRHHPARVTHQHHYHCRAACYPSTPRMQPSSMRSSRNVGDDYRQP
jgi:hypothetical protein